MRKHSVLFLAPVTLCLSMLGAATGSAQTPSEGGQAATYSLENAPLELVGATKPYQATALTGSCEQNPLVVPGRGYNTLTGCFRGNAVVNVVPPNTGGGGNLGQKVEYSLTEIESYSELRTVLGIAAAASFDAYAYGGSFSFSYMKEMQMHRYSSYLLVLVQVTNSTAGLTEFNLRADTLAVAKKVKPEVFLDRFGDSFVVSTTTGGRFIALVEFLSEDRSQQEATKTELRAHAGKFEASVDFQQSLSSLSKNLVTKVKVHKEGGIGPIPPQEKLVEAALNFPTEVNEKTGHPILYAFSTLDYKATSNWPTNLPLPPTLDEQHRTIEKLTADRDECLTLKDDIGYIKERPAQFDKPDIPSLDRKLQLLDDDLTKTNAAGNSVLEHPLKPIQYPTVDYSQIRPLPDRILSVSIPLKVKVTVRNVGALEFPDHAWAGVTTDQTFLISKFSVALNPQVPQLGIKYHIRYVCLFAGAGNAVHYLDGADGQDVDIPITQYSGCWLNGISFELTGYKAKFYDVEYRGHFWQHGDSQLARNGDWVSIGTPGQGGWLGNDDIEAVWIAVTVKSN